MALLKKCIEFCGRRFGLLCGSEKAISFEFQQKLCKNKHEFRFGQSILVKLEPKLTKAHDQIP